MSPPILATKLYRPRLQPQGVRRPRLIERLQAGLHRKLTVISAPAGFGKTTLLSEWVAGHAGATAWVSLDEKDSDLTRFLTYLVAALQSVVPTIGAAVMAVLQSSQPPSTDVMLTALLNDISTMPGPLLLVLDDYHLVDARPVDDALTFLLEHLPPQMHLVITTREDPQLPLSRLRARGQMLELRLADLRFTTGEAAAFLQETMGLDLSAEDIAALEERTEGWIAGLQLAALSMQGHQDRAGFIRAFAGDNRYIVDYLVDEVLERQPEPVRDFLLQTAILDRLSGPLCDAVTGQANSRGRLEAFHRENLFVIPLDDTRHWYRYHHLFAEVLSAHLRAEQPALITVLHHRASEWFEHNDSPADAIRHALAAADFERAAELVELAWLAMSRRRQDATLLGWLRALPDEVISCRPVLSVVYAHLVLAGGMIAGVDERLRDAERWLDSNTGMHSSAGGSHPSVSMAVVDQGAFRRLPGMIAVARVGHAMALGDIAQAVSYARQVLDLVPENDHFSRGGASAFLGLASWARGDLETAHRLYGDGMAQLQLAGNISDAINGAILLAEIRIAQGRLHEAMRIYEHALHRATQDADDSRPVVRGAADIHVGMSMLHHVWNDLEVATWHLQRSTELGEHLAFPQNRYRKCIALARLREAHGDRSGALALLDEAERLYVSDFSPNVRPIAALKARVWIAQGRLREALDWSRERGISTADGLSYVREFEHITLARLLLAQYLRDRDDRTLDEALDLLHHLMQAADEGERTGSVIEILVVQVLAHRARGDISAALAALQRALLLAEPEGYVRMFVDEGQPMAALLLEAAARGIQPGYTGKLLAAYGVEHLASASSPPHPLSSPSSLVEPLSERELDVLRLLKTELSGPEIANELMIALSTLRTHTKSIFSKLEVTNRRAAVNRAAELHLI